MHIQALSVVTLASGLVAWAIYSFLDKRRHVMKAKAKGCKPPVQAMSREPTGIANLFRGLMASRQMSFLDFLLECMNDLSQRIGRPAGTVVVRNALFRDAIITYDPENIQAILARQFQDFGLGVNRTDNLKPLLGNGIFASNGDQWQHCRALLRPQFARTLVSDLSVQEKHVQAMMTVLESKLGADHWTSIVDLQVLLFRLTLDSATEFFFGESVQSQLDSFSNNASNETHLSFADAFDSVQTRLGCAARLGANYWLLHTRDLYQRVNRVHGFVDRFVDLAVKNNQDGKPTASSGRHTLLYTLSEQIQDPVELRCHLTNILLAGRDTTASTLGWFFYIMAEQRNEDYYRRLRATIIENFGEYTDPHDITFESMKSCQYLQWCISECLRLYPVVPVNTRTAMVDTTLPTGGGPDGTSPVYVKKGAGIAYSVHLMHRRKDLWGDDASEFKPERWEKRRTGWEYLPFNGGPRICIGQQFALTEVAYVIIRCVQRIEAIDGSEMGPVRHGLSLTNCPRDGVNIKLRFAER